MIAQDESFEEPCRVGKVPFGWRGVRIGLNGSIRIRQWRGEVERQRARRRKAGRQAFPLHFVGPSHFIPPAKITVLAGICFNQD